jgi:hypothetical protein
MRPLRGAPDSRDAIAARRFRNRFAALDLPL